MTIGKERHTKNVIYVGGAPSVKPGYGIMYLLGPRMMYYYEYVLPKLGQSRDAFMTAVMNHCTEYDGKMRISFVFGTNIIHTLTPIVNPHFIGMDAELPPFIDEDDALDEANAENEEGEGEEGMEDGYFEDGGMEDGAWEEEGGVRPLAGTENVPHEAIGSVESIADTPIPFELWLFSIKKLGQNFAAATQNFERLSDEEKEALMAEYNATFGF